MAVRECRECGERMTAAEYPAHKAAHRAAPPRSTRMRKPCRVCGELVASHDWHRHLQQHADRNPDRPRTRSGTYAWRKLREKVLDRDHHRCTNCGRTTDLQVHHLDPGVRWRDHSTPDAELVPMSRLLTLCRDCHDRLA